MGAAAGVFLGAVAGAGIVLATLWVNRQRPDGSVRVTKAQLSITPTLSPGSIVPLADEGRGAVYPFAILSYTSGAGGTLVELQDLRSYERERRL